MLPGKLVPLGLLRQIGASERSVSRTVLRMLRLCSVTLSRAAVGEHVMVREAGAAATLGLSTLYTAAATQPASALRWVTPLGAQSPGHSARAAHRFVSTRGTGRSGDGGISALLAPAASFRGDGIHRHSATSSPHDPCCGPRSRALASSASSAAQWGEGSPPTIAKSRLAPRVRLPSCSLDPSRSRSCAHSRTLMPTSNDLEFRAKAH